MALAEAGVFTNKISPIKGNPVCRKIENSKEVVIYRIKGAAHILRGEKEGICKAAEVCKDLLSRLLPSG